MLETLRTHLTKHPRITGAIIAALAVFIFVGYRFTVVTKELQETRADFANTKADLELDLSNLTDERNKLSEALYSEQQKNSAFEEQIGEIADAVGTIEEWTKLDPELLQKYSKVYFLNEHYVPQLTEVDEQYLVRPEKPEQIHTEVWKLLEDLLEDAKDDGHELRIISSYRSFEEQAGLKSAYTITYGAGTANQFSADQGYSEHQLGTAVDFTNIQLGTSFTDFGQTKAYQWLLDNAYRYGFVLSYPEENGYYIFEPWHWRFVGRSLARTLRREGKSFYDLDQRKIDTHLIDIFN